MGHVIRTTTWRKELEYARQGEMDYPNDAGSIVAYAPNEAAFDVEFDKGYGLTEGPPVLAWSERFVYFPVCYDGAEWMGRAPRDPQPQGQEHVGGG